MRRQELRLSLVFFHTRLHQMLANPMNECLFTQLSRRCCQNRIGGVRLVSDESPVILAQENAQRSKGGAFVAIYKWMIAEDSKNISRAQASRVADFFVSK